MYNKSTKFYVNRWSHFWEKENFKFLLCEVPVILRVDRKTKKRARDFCKGTLDIEFQRDWSFRLGATLGDGQKIKNYFSSFSEFSGKSRYCHIVGFRMYYKPTKFNKNRCSYFFFFEKIKFFFLFFSHVTYP